MLQCTSQLPDLIDGRQVGSEKSSWDESRFGVGHHPPRLGQIEDNPIELRTCATLDTFVDVPDLDPEVGTLAAERFDVMPSPLSEILPYLVPDHVRSNRNHGHRQGTRPNPCLQHATSRTDVRAYHYRAEVFRVNHLSTSGHPHDRVGKSWAHHYITGSSGSDDGRSVIPPDQHVVAHPPGMGVELGTGGQSDGVLPAFSIDQNHSLPGLEGAAAHPPGERWEMTRV